MSSRETDFVTIMQADGTLMSILTGGVYAAGALGREGLTREEAPGAFDANGWLKPAAVVRERSLVPDNYVRDGLAQATSVVQVVEIYCYADGSGAALEPVIDRLYALFEGRQFDDTFPVALANVIKGQRDTGALDGAAMCRVDFAVYSVWGD